MKKHDNLCPNAVLSDSIISQSQCSFCPLIAKVRADEREQAAQRVEAALPKTYIKYTEVPFIMEAIKGGE